MFVISNCSYSANMKFACSPYFNLNLYLLQTFFSENLVTDTSCFFLLGSGSTIPFLSNKNNNNKKKRKTSLVTSKAVLTNCIQHFLLHNLGSKFKCSICFISLPPRKPAQGRFFFTKPKNKNRQEASLGRKKKKLCDFQQAQAAWKSIWKRSHIFSFAFCFFSPPVAKVGHWFSGLAAHRGQQSTPPTKQSDLNRLPIQ